MHLLFSDDLKVQTAIHTTIEACARISGLCDLSSKNSLFVGKR